MKFSIIVPTYNAGRGWKRWCEILKKQNIYPFNALVIDSSSKDNTASMAFEQGLNVCVIKQSNFNHGGTRQYGVECCEDSDVIVFLTQDAFLYDDNALSSLLSAFEAPDVAAVCGRQLPRKKAGLIESHARLYNYPEISILNSLSDVNEKGLKTAFISNSYAAYRVSMLKEIGGFPDNVIFGEDMYVATKLLKSGYKIAYAANACVYHSHSYTFWQEFKRYFDMGVFHAREPWIRQELGGAEGEGVKFLISEFKYLLKHAFWLIPESILRTIFRYAGFRFGLIEKKLPVRVKIFFAMNKGYFE